MNRVITLFLGLLISGSAFTQDVVIWASEVIDLSSEFSPYEYSGIQALHKPNVLPGGGDNPNAWRPKDDKSDQFIMVSFKTPVRAKQVAIAESENFRRLKELHLDNTGIGDEVKALANSKTLTGLEKLYLCSNKIGDEGAIALANSTHLKSLKALSIWRNEIRDAGGQAIIESKTFDNLERLYMSFNYIEKPALKMIRKSKLAARLKTLVMD